jgi:ABC-type lipoprotein export system ATPase subunit
LDAETAGPVGLPAESSTIDANRINRLRRVWVRNFKGFQSFEISLGDFNVLAGPNNSGKSTLLQAADLLFRLIDLHRQGNELVEGRLLPPALLPVARLRDLWYQRQYRSGNKFVQAIVGAEFDDSAKIEFGISGPFGAANSKLLQGKEFDPERLAELKKHPAVWVPSSVGIVRDEEFRPPARRQGLIADGRHNEILRNQLLALRELPEEDRELQEILSTYFGGSLGDVHFDQSIDQFVTAIYRSENVQHDLYSVGAGFLQVVQLLAFILVRTPTVVLLDEPDAHLHSSLQHTVIDVLDRLSKSRGMQVVLSTHSKEIINYVDPSRLILIERGSSSASSSGAAATQMTILQSLGEIDSVDAYALVRNKRCLFVEGRTDVPILERLASRLGMTPFVGDNRVVMVPVGGADRFEHVSQLDVLEAVLGAPMATFEIRDRDCRTDVDRARAVAEAVRPLHVLELDSIESYLVRPSVIARVVAAVESEGERRNSPSADDIEKLCVELTQELRDETFDRAATRFVTEQYRATHQHPAPAAMNKAARDLVDSCWSDLGSRLRIVSGKRLLASLRKRLQDEYSVSFGNRRLVEEFTAAEIPEELVRVLRQVSDAIGPTVGRGHEVEPGDAVKPSVGQEGRGH